MRDIFFALLVGFGVLAIALWLALVAIGYHEPGAQLHNAYWPFSVETSVRDR